MNKIKKSAADGIYLILLIIVNVLMFMNLVEKNQEPVLGVASRKGIFLMQIGVNVLILLVYGIIVRWIRNRKSVKYTYTAVILSPIVEVLLLETIVGHLSGMPYIAIGINLLIAYVLLVLFLLFFQRIRTALIWYNVWMPILGLVQYYVYKFRGRSFMLADISSAWTAAQVADGYSFALDFGTGAAVLAAIGWLFLMTKITDIKIKKFRIIRKIMVIGVCVVSVHFLCDSTFAAKHNVLRMDMWDTENDYVVKGYLLNLMAQMQYLKTTAPENYSEQRVVEIAEQYSRQYDEKIEKTNVAEAEQPVNLIVIMNESWADLRNFEEFHEIDSVTPFIDQMSENTTKGWIYAPVFGGGTANTEYEVLTGNSTALFKNRAAIAYQVYCQEQEYGLASTLSAQGYRTMVLHPADALNYNRKQVYPQMGFEQFISKEDWPKEFNQKLRKFTSDQACYDYLAQICEDKDTDEKLFAFLVTMQNHASYGYKKYESTVDLDYGEEYPKAEQYLSLLKESDAAFENLIHHFEEVEELTMIVMFGDHLPNLTDGFYDEIIEGGWTNASAEELRTRYTTPFVLWTNYDRPTDTDIMMSSSYFGSYILQQMGAELTDYNKFLLELYEKMPVVGHGEELASDGTWYPRSTLPDDLAEMVNSYEILQYNNMFAKKQRIDSIFTVNTSKG